MELNPLAVEFARVSLWVETLDPELPFSFLDHKLKVGKRQEELFDSVPGVAEAWDEYNARFKALGNWARNLAGPFDLPLARGREGTGLEAVWARHRQKHAGVSDHEHPFRLQGIADLNSYKMFAEVFWNLLRPDGRVGVILPTGIYSELWDEGSAGNTAGQGPDRPAVCVPEREAGIHRRPSRL